LNNGCIHDPFPTSFSDEVPNNVAGSEAYSFMDGFSGYHQVHNGEEDKTKTTFTTKCGSYAYHVMSFGLKNAPLVFSRIVIATFRNYIHKFLEVYMDDWKIYNLLKRHSNFLRVMFFPCRKLQISLKFKFIFAIPFGTLLRHIVCKEGVCINLAKVAIILNMPPPTSVKKLRLKLGHT